MESESFYCKSLNRIGFFFNRIKKYITGIINMDVLRGGKDGVEKFDGPPFHLTCIKNGIFFVPIPTRA